MGQYISICLSTVLNFQMLYINIYIVSSQVSTIVSQNYWPYLLLLGELKKGVWYWWMDSGSRDARVKILKKKLKCHFNCFILLPTKPTFSSQKQKDHHHPLPDPCYSLLRLTKIIYAKTFIEKLNLWYHIC